VTQASQADLGQNTQVFSLSLLLSLSSLAPMLRFIHKRRPDISDELRGWSWMQPPLLFPYDNIRLSVSETYSTFCPSGRDIYLKHVLHRKAQPTAEQLEGYLIHHILAKSITALKRHVAAHPADSLDLFEKVLAEKENLRLTWANYLQSQDPRPGAETLMAKFETYFREVCVPLALESSSEYAKSLMSNPFATEETVLAKVAPFFTEFEVDGTPLGFSDICRIDYLTPFGLIVDVKTAYPNEMHSLAAAVYALIVEANFEIPIDYALLLYVWLQKGEHLRVTRRLIPVTEALRLKAIEIRDQKAKIVAEGFDPDPNEQCSPTCPYRQLTERE